MTTHETKQRVSVDLSEGMYQDLSALAKEMGVPMTVVHRWAIGAYIESYRQREKNLSLGSICGTMPATDLTLKTEDAPAGQG